MPIADDTKVRLAPVLDALRGDLERHRTKATAIEALITQLVEYVGDVEPANTNSDSKPKRRRRRGRPPSDRSERVKRRDKMRAYRRAKKAALPVTKPARKRRRRAKAAAKAADPVAANDHGKTNVNSPSVSSSGNFSENASTRAFSPEPMGTAEKPQAAAAGDLCERIGAIDDIHEIIRLHATARASIKSALKEKDVVVFRAAHELKLRAERRGGEILVAGGRNIRIGALGLSCAPEWRQLASLSADAFEATLIVPLATRELPWARKDPACSGRVARTLTAWQTDADGVMTRVLVGEGEAVPLRGEGHPQSLV